MAIDIKATSAIPVGVRKTLGLPVSVLVYGAAGDGVADDTAEVHAARDAAGVGGHVYFPAGTYKVNALVMNVAGQTWELAPGATLKTVTTQTTVTMSAAGCTLRGGTVDGESVGSSAGTNVYITGADCVVERVKFVDAEGIGVNCQGQRAVIDGCTFTDCGGTAIFVQTAGLGADLVDVRVSNNYIVNAGTTQYGIQVYGFTGPTTTPRRVKVIGNLVSLPAGAATGICIESHTGCRDLDISHNTVLGGQMGISVDNSPGTRVAENVCVGAYSYGIEVASSNQCSVVGNTIQSETVTDRGIALTGASPSSRCTVTGNTVIGCADYQVYANGGNRNTISGNYVQGNQAIYLASTTAHTVTGNVIYGAGAASNLDAVILDTSDEAVVSGNVFDDYTRSGVLVYSAGAFTADNLILGPNLHRGGTPGDPAVLLGSAAYGTGIHLTKSGDTTTTVAPGAGGAGALPATPLGYVTVNVAGTDRKIAYY
jgi:parallel beta-helix repeat protein